MNKRILISLFVIALLIQLYTTHSYLDTLAQRRSREMSEKIWTEVEKGLPRFDTKKIYVVLFASGDNINGDIIYNNAFFGFSPRMAIRDKIAVYRMPFAVTGYNEVVSAVTDGETLRNNGYAKKPISPDQIIAFLITGQTLDKINIQNVTEQVREDLKVRSAEYLKAHQDITYQE